MKSCYFTAAILILFKISVVSQQDDLQKISGYIVDESHNAISFATVYSKVRDKGTISGKNGRFTIKASIDDTLELSSVSYHKMQISVKQILQGDSMCVMQRKTYNIDEVDVMALRWYDFKQNVLSTEAKEENKKVMQLAGLPSVYQPRIELGPYAGMTNPVSILLLYFSKQERNKRRKKRWNEIYLKYNPPIKNNPLGMQKKSLQGEKP